MRGRARYVVTLRLEPRAAERIRSWRTATASPASSGEDGRITLSVQFDDEEQASFVILGLGAGVDVLEPEPLRRRIAAEVTEMMERQHAVAPPRG
jgi:hypothetical protein